MTKFNKRMFMAITYDYDLCANLTFEREKCNSTQITFGGTYDFAQRENQFSICMPKKKMIIQIQIESDFRVQNYAN